MDKTTVITVLTSAAVGALVSVVGTAIGQYIERNARRKELLLSKALELAFSRQNLVMKVADAAGGKAEIQDAATLAAEYYRVLEHVMENGTLPEYFAKQATDSKERLRGQNK